MQTLENRFLEEFSEEPSLFSLENMKIKGRLDDSFKISNWLLFKKKERKKVFLRSESRSWAIGRNFGEADFRTKQWD